MFEKFTRDELEGMLHDAALNWPAHDGLWFLAVEEKLGPDVALDLDEKAWEKFTVIEARRILKRHHIEPGGGLPSLAKALERRLYSLVNRHEVVEQTDHRLVFRMNECRVHAARERKRLESPPPDYPAILPELRRKVIIIDYDFGEMRYEMDLYRTSRIDCYKAVVNGKVWKFRVGWSGVLAGIRKSLPRVKGLR